MTSLTTPIQNQYGSYVFSVYSETLNVTARPIYDQAGRTVVYVVFTIAIRDYIQSDTGTNAAMQAARVQLEAPARPFTYVNAGFGDLRINITGQRDVVWGPKPQMLSCKPKGGGNCWEIEWQVQVAMCDCGNPCAFGRIMEFNYSMATSIQKNGLSRRTYSGFIRIPNTRSNADSRELTDNADRYFEQIVPPLIPGFARGDRSRTLDESKCRLNFTITDEEMPSIYAPPPGCVEAHFSHSVESNDAANVQWQGTFTGNYELPKGGNSALALQFFMATVNSRWAATRTNAQSLSIVPTRFSMREPDVYGAPKAEFSLSYTYATNPEKLVAATGLWTKVPNSNWQAWANALNGNAQSARGIAGLAFKNTDDAIWDLCEAENNIPAIPGTPQVALGVFNFGSGLTFPKPSAAQSWLDYQNAIRIEPVDGNVVLRRLPAAAAGFLPGAVIPWVAAAQIAGYVLPWASIPGGTIIQERCGPTVYAIMEGWARRVGYGIPPPTLRSVGGATAKPINRPGYGYAQKVAGNYGGIPVVIAFWRLRYILDRVPNGPINPPANPMLGNGTLQQNQTLPALQP